MRIWVLDNDVDIAVRAVLLARGLKVETASSLGLADADDDELAVRVDNMGGVLISHDRRFGQGRASEAMFGRHVWLRCRESDAPEVLESWMDQVLLAVLREPCVVELRPNSMETKRPGWSESSDGQVPRKRKGKRRA